MRSMRLLAILILLLAGCNLDSQLSATLAPTPTALVVATATPDLLPVTPVPADALLENPEPPPTSQNVIDIFVNNFVIPVWNFLYTFISDGLVTLWSFAGARGGVFAQVFCCVLPIFLAGGLLLLRLRLWTLRR